MPKAPMIASSGQMRTATASEASLVRLKARAAAPARDASRVDWVDAAKGLSILLVVMMHSTLGLGEALGRDGWLHAVVAFAQPFRIPAFFLIAGLFLSRGIDESWGRYIDRKVLHFVYFYLLWMFIQCAIKSPPTAIGIEGFARQFAFGLVEPFGTLWFIYLLPIFFVVTKLARRAPVWLVFAEAVVMHVWPHHTGFTAVDEFMSRFVFFYAGYALAPQIFALAATARRRPDAAIAAIGAVFALIAAAVLIKAPFGPGGSLAAAPGLTLVFGALGAAALVSLAALLAPTAAGRALAFCGERSIVIYLAFFLPMAATRIALVKSGLVGPVLDVGTASLIVTTVAVLTPLILHRLVAGGPFGWLFARPDWARLSTSDATAAMARPPRA